MSLNVSGLPRTVKPPGNWGTQERLWWELSPLESLWRWKAAVSILLRSIVQALEWMHLKAGLGAVLASRCVEGRCDGARGSQHPWGSDAGAVPLEGPCLPASIHRSEECPRVPAAPAPSHGQGSPVTGPGDHMF
ncbi:hypothetical protein NDU88_006317 [Pleurodeles waltl]|uniref:Uncharacterized protein n=1 Tax=Pleurodeles waltl TaxID=8319 RepID=A0AAV7L9Y7_PLEWA|nr:hypothetical protein NDU88_006317 [Pleurodeles waltl]